MKIQKSIIMCTVLGLFLIGTVASLHASRTPEMETAQQKTSQQNTSTQENATQENATQENSKQETTDNQNGKTVVNTYRLNYISPYKVEKELGEYIIEMTILKNPSRIRVKMKARDAALFEDLLQDLDYKPETVGKRLKKVGKSISNFTDNLFKKKPNNPTIIINVFTVIASRNQGNSDIKKPELKDVLEELRRVLSFNSFTLDGESTVSIKEKSPYNLLELSSRYPGLKLRLDRLKIKGKQIGYREIVIGSLILREGRNPLISTGTSIQEDGFLVVGVTQVGEEEDSLVLVLHAKIP